MTIPNRKMGARPRRRDPAPGGDSEPLSITGPAKSIISVRTPGANTVHSDSADERHPAQRAKNKLLQFNRDAGADMLLERDRTTSTEGRIAFVKSSDAPGRFSCTEFSDCLQSLAVCMDIKPDTLPHIMVMHVSRKLALRFGVMGTGIIRHNRAMSGEPRSYYEIWLVGRPNVDRYVCAILGVLEDCFSLALSSDERQRALESAAWMMATSRSRLAVVQ